MSVASDLARNRAVFAAMAEAPVAGAPALPLPARFPRIAEAPAMAAPLAIPFAERSEPPYPDEPRVIHTLGAIPDARYEPPPSPETALRYPEPAVARVVARGDGGPLADETYKTLLRRFDEDARQGSQLTGEEAL